MWISPDDSRLQYSGRIDFSNPQAPVLIWPSSYVRLRFQGADVAVELENRRAYWKNDIGYVLDGEVYQVRLQDDGTQRLVIKTKKEEQKEHELILYKRMDACHHVTIHGFELGDDAVLLQPSELPKRRIEVYGDSVSAGEVSEAVAYVKKSDPVHEGQYSNSWYSYAWMTARKLDAQLHNIAQGGVALLPGTGWFAEPDYIGMEQIYDKVSYHPSLGEIKEWDFSRYVPQVVIVAIGQNDNHPTDYMADDPAGEQAQHWKNHYEQFVRKLRAHYPKATMILTTTILEHHKNWDDAIEEVCQRLQDEKIHHFLYRDNGCGTPGHIRIPEAEQMAEELSSYIESLGADIWI